ncbi:MAG TPA: phosphoribosyltransferase family protein [Myxococcota bacterium]|nr:phosphoribosyltransferase family protein [Myxococcota bacterium]
MAHLFDNRLDAARQLGDALRRYRGTRPLVLAIPRGAVPMAARIADALDGELDVVLVRKLGAPGNEELALGSVDEAGWTYVSDFARDLGLDEDYLAGVRERQLELLRRRRALYTPGRAAIDPRGRTCIVVDDGLATGATMIAALHGVRARAPAKLVAAAPVASREALARIGSLADEVVCLDTPAEFHAVGTFYLDFGQVSDEEVARVLASRPIRARDPPQEIHHEK